MKIFVSDLHMGDGSRTDDFHRDKEFLFFLDFVEEGQHELIIVGDLFELWQADFDRVIFQHSDVINRILSLKDKLKVTYVVGNHDYIPFAKFVDYDIGVCLRYRDSGNNLVAEHGHQYDIFNRYKNPLRSIKWPSGKRFTLFVATLERLIHTDIDRWTQKTIENLDEFMREAIVVRNKVTPSTKKYFQRGGHFGEFEAAVKDYITNGENLVIFGHTHKAQLEKIEGGIYANCGTWVDGITPTYIACDKDKIELREALTHKALKVLVIAGRCDKVKSKT